MNSHGTRHGWTWRKNSCECELSRICRLFFVPLPPMNSSLVIRHVIGGERNFYRTLIGPWCLLPSNFPKSCRNWTQCKQQNARQSDAHRASTNSPGIHMHSFFSHCRSIAAHPKIKDSGWMNGARGEKKNL